MLGNYSEEARKIIVSAKQEMKELKHPYVGSEHLMLAILKDNNEISKYLKKYEIDYEKFKKEIINIVGIGKEESHWFLYTPLLKKVLENAQLDAKEKNEDVMIYHLFSSLLEEGEGVAIRILIGLNVDMDELYDEFSCKIIHKKTNKKLTIDELGIDLNEKAKKSMLDPVVCRDDEIKRILEILSRRTKNNPILVGDAGVGKTAIVEELSRMIVNKEVPYKLQEKRILSLDMASIVAGTKYRGEFEEKIKKILCEVEENDNIILFIDEIHTIVGAGGAEGAIDASNILKPSLARGKIRCIGATTYDEYKKFIEKDSALDRRFQKVEIKSPNKEQVKEILHKLKPIYEKYHLVEIDDNIIDYIIELSNKYIYDRNEPDRSIDILDEVCAKSSLKENKNIRKYNELIIEKEKIINDKNECIISNNFDKAYKYKEKENVIDDKINHLQLKMSKENKKIVTKEDVVNVVSTKTKIPENEIMGQPKDFKINDIIGQDNAIKELEKIYKKINLGVKDGCYSILITGSSGVGKSELAKIFAKIILNDDDYIKLDMNEYSDAYSISKLIGTTPGYVGYNDYKSIFEKIRTNSHTVLILDEIEKASSNIIRLFNQILEDSKIVDNSGKEIRFDNTIIIMTTCINSNNELGFNSSNQIDQLSEILDKSFISKIDNIINLNKLSKENTISIIQNNLKKLKNKYCKKNINLNITENIIQDILEMTDYELYGANKIKNIIKDKIEIKVIDEILNNKTDIIIDSIKQSV